MVSEESLPDLDDSLLDIYSTKTITNTYYGLLEKLQSGNNGSGNKRAADGKDKEENRPSTSRGAGGGDINVNDPCTSKDANIRHFNLDELLASNNTSRSQFNLNEPSTSKEMSPSQISEDSCTSSDSSGSTTTSSDPCNVDRPSVNSMALVEKNNLDLAIIDTDDSNNSTPAGQLAPISLRGRAAGRGGRARGRARGIATGRGRAITTGRGRAITTGRGRAITTGRGRGARTSGTGQGPSEVQVIHVSPVPRRRRRLLPEIVYLSDDDLVEAPLTLYDDINYEVSVKILWMSVNIKIFYLRKFQKFAPIFEYFMKEENVPYENIMLKLKGVKIGKNDTPDSVGLKACDFIDGGVLTAVMLPISLYEAQKAGKGENCLTIKLQDKTKIIHRLTIKKNEMLKVIMVKYAEQTEIPLRNLKFYYDGDLVKPSDTPDSLGISNDEIIDVKY